MLWPWLNRIVILLIIGAAINVAVCWGIAFLQGPRDPGRARVMSALECEAIWSRAMPATSAVAEPPVGERGQQAGRRWRIVMKSSPMDAAGARDSIKPRDESALMIESEYGWPWGALVSRANVQVGRQVMFAVWGGRWIGTPDELFRRHELRALAWQPVWLGFGVNTLIYAALAAVVLEIPRRRRRRWRRIRGKCVHCGYDVRGVLHDRCPECGKTIAARSSR